LRAANVDVSLYVQARSSESSWVRAPKRLHNAKLARLRGAVDRLPLRVYRRRRKPLVWSLNWLPNPGIDDMFSTPADIVHLHWIGGAFLPIKALRRFVAPIVWTLHDMWAFTGGCHYDDGCGRFTDRCGSCPQLGSRNAADISRAIWSMKASAWSELPITVVSPSRWLAAEARRSSLFAERRIEVIPNGVDLSTFRPLHKQQAKAALGIPAGCKLVLFGAISATTDPRKGYEYLQQALSILGVDPQWHGTLQLMVFGGSTAHQDAAFPFPVRSTGEVRDDTRLVTLYSAADVMVVPSTQENLANTIMEALACGTPVVAFDIGGNPDMVDHMVNGYLARPFAADDLARGIAWVLAEEGRFKTLSEQARGKCEARFSIVDCARRYIDLYESVRRPGGSIRQSTAEVFDG
jgi:glycosyltransferase involved in cell wall biosynthesis